MVKVVRVSSLATFTRTIEGMAAWVRYYVYCHTSPSGKKYVGLTKSLERRWKEHVSDAKSGSPLGFHKALRKYGHENFTHEILEVMSTRTGANKAEKLWIARLKTRSHAGYNETDGGEGGDISSGRKRSPETRALLSRLRLGRRKLTPEQQEEARKLVFQGLTYKEAAKALGVHKGSIYKAVPAHRKRMLTVDEVDRIKRLAEFGISKPAIANLFSLSEQTVYRRCKEGKKDGNATSKMARRTRAERNYNG